MSKKHSIKLADAIREHNRILSHITDGGADRFTDSQLSVLANFLKSQNSSFNRGRWLAYIAGECGPNGGEIKNKAA